MLRMVRRLALVCCVALAAPACGGGGESPGKTAKKPGKSSSRDSKALLSEARDAARNGELDDADAAYGKAYEVAKEFEILEEHVDFLIHAGRATRAQEVAKAFYEANTTNPKGYDIYAEALLAGSDGAGAKAIADEMIGLYPDEPGGHEKLGRALILLDKPDEGVEELRKAVGLDSGNADLQLSLGLALHNLKKVDEAALAFRAALKKAPEDSKAHTYLGMALRDQGELDESKTYLDKAIELDGDNGRAYFELGLLYNRQGKQADAEIALSRAVQKSPNESLFWYAYGEIYRLQKRIDDAMNAYKKAVDLDPPYPKAVAKLTQLLIERKQLDEAENVLTPALRREPKQAAYHFQLGALQAARRKPRDAIQSYQRYLELAPRNDPDRDRARDEIKDLKRR